MRKASTARPEARAHSTPRSHRRRTSCHTCLCWCSGSLPYVARAQNEGVCEGSAGATAPRPSARAAPPSEAQPLARHCTPACGQCDAPDCGTPMCCDHGKGAALGRRTRIPHIGRMHRCSRMRAAPASSRNDFGARQPRCCGPAGGMSAARATSWARLAHVGWRALSRPLRLHNKYVGGGSVARRARCSRTARPHVCRARQDGQHMLRGAAPGLRCAGGHLWHEGLSPRPVAVLACPRALGAAVAACA